MKVLNMAIREVLVSIGEWTTILLHNKKLWLNY
ncbi:hypothetical protein MHOCP_06870 [Moorella humiferrea]